MYKRKNTRLLSFILVTTIVLTSINPIAFAESPNIETPDITANNLPMNTINQNLSNFQVPFQELTGNDDISSLIIDQNTAELITDDTAPALQPLSVNSDFLIDSNGTLSDYTGTGGAIVIPEYLGIKNIGNAFKNRTDITSVLIPDGVLSIGYYAFEGCSSLSSITLPNSITSIGSGAFYGCINLNSITLPSSITKIEDYTFYNCNLTEVNIPEGVTVIGNSAFSGCSNLTSIILPNSLTSLGSNVFFSCSKLTTITIPNTVTSIGSYAFSRCSSLTSVIIPEGVTTIGNYTFSECSNLTTISIPNTMISIGSNAFSDCSKLTSVTIPNSVTSIGPAAFSGCYSLASITLPSGLTRIEASVFTECNLTSIIIPTGVTSIGNNAFYKCCSLTSVTIPDNVTVIGNSAFSGCSNLTSIILPNSLTSLGSNVFFGCSKLTTITIPNTVTSIGSYAFSRCSSLTSVIIPEGVTTIGNYTFSECSNLTTITIPNTMISIGSNAFSDCSKLTSVPIPNSVTSIGGAAFSGCDNLTSITLPSGLTSIEAFTFTECNLTSIIIPTGATSIGNYAFYKCSSLISVTIPDSVTVIGNSAFSGCSNLSSIIIPSGVTSIGSTAFYSNTTIIGDAGSYAESYALQNNLKFQSLGPVTTQFLLESGNSIVYMNDTTDSHLLQFSSAIEYVRYDASNTVVAYAIDGKYIAASPGERVVITNSSSSDISYSGIDKEAGTSPLPALRKIYLSSNSGYRLSNLSSSGQKIYASNSFNANYISYNPDVVITNFGKIISGCFNLLSGQTIEIVPESNAMVYMPYEMDDSIIKFESIGADIIYEVTIPIGSNYEFVNNTSQNVYVSNDSSYINRFDALQYFSDGSARYIQNKYGLLQIFSNGKTIVKNTSVSDITFSWPKIDRDNNFITERQISEQITDLFVMIPKVTMHISRQLTNPSGVSNILQSSDSISNYKIAAYNVTQAKPIENLVLQRESVVFPIGSVSAGDVIELSINSNKTVEKKVSITIGADCSAVADIVTIEKGYFTASFIPKNNDGISIKAALFNDAGINVNYFNVGNNHLDSGFLTAGVYDLVVIKPGVLNWNFSDINEYYRRGLEEGIDFIKLRVEITDNVAVKLPLVEVPTCPEEKLTYFDLDKRSFTSNLSTTSVNGLIQCTLNYRFKDIYDGRISNEIVSIQIPNEVNYVIGSLVVNGVNNRNFNLSSTKSYKVLRLSGIGKEGYLKFFIRPSASQDFTAMADISFSDINQRDITERIGTIEINVPIITIYGKSVVDNGSITVNGIAPFNSSVKVFDGYNLIGKSTADSRGKWSIDCTLAGSFDGSRHFVRASVYNNTVEEQYSNTLVVINKTTFSNINKVTLHHVGKIYDITRAFQNGENPLISFFPFQPLTFVIQASNSNLINRMYITSTKNGETLKIEAIYDGDTDAWVATGKFNHLSLTPGILGIEIQPKKGNLNFDPNIQSISPLPIATNPEITVEELPKIGAGQEKFKVTVGDGISFIVTYNTTTPDQQPATEGMAHYTTDDGRDMYYDKSITSDSMSVKIYDSEYNTIYEQTIEKDSSEMVKAFSEYADDLLDVLGSNVPFYGLIKSGYQIGYCDENWENMSQEEKARAVIDIITSIVESAYPASGLVNTLLAISTMEQPDTTNYYYYGIALTTALRWVIDPSGYIYEVVPENRLENVNVTAYFIDDQGNERIWNASEYDQKNPLITDSQGKYAWDVPEGMWKVKCEKEGYQTAYSDWLPVPPPQTEVNIPMISVEPPEIADVIYYNDHAVLKFNKYVDSSKVNNSAVSISDGTNTISGIISPIDAVLYNGMTVAKVYCFSITIGNLYVGSQYTLTVLKDIKSYAGVSPVADLTYSKTYFELPQSISVGGNITIPYKTTQTLEVAVNSQADYSNLSITAVSSDSSIAKMSSDTYVIGSGGSVEIPVEGVLPGVVEITLSLNGTEIMQKISVEVSMPIIAAKALKSELQKAISIAKVIDTTKYTDESVAAMQVAMQAAFEVNSDEIATQAEVDSATTALNETINNLTVYVVQIDKSILISKINAALEKIESVYTPGSWVIFANALSIAQSVLNNKSASQQEVDEATNSLTLAVGGLTERANKTELQSAINIAQTIDTTKYTAESSAAMKAVLETALAENANANATQADVDSYTTALNAAINNLVIYTPPVDKSNLINEVNIALEKNETVYTPASWLIFANALSIAQSVLNNSVSQQEVDEATNSLTLAVDGLTERANKTELQSAINTAQTIDTTKYTVESTAAMQAALVTAFAVNANENAAQSEVDSAISELNRSIGGLLIQLKVTNLTSDKPSPQTLPVIIRWNCEATGNSLEYRFDVLKGGNQVVAGTFGAVNTFDWVPLEAGSDYQIQVFIRDLVSGLSETKVSSYFEVKVVPALAIISLTSDKPSPQMLSNTVRWVCEATGENLTYRYDVFKGRKIVLAETYGTSNYFDWTPKATGDYQIVAYAKDGTGSIVKTSSYYTITAVPPISIVSLSSDKQSPQMVSSSIRWSCNATGLTLTYRFDVLKGKKAILTGSYGAANYFDWTPAEFGDYQIKVYVKDATGAVVTKTSSIYRILGVQPVTIISFTSDIPSPQTVLNTIRWQCIATGENLSYRFDVLKRNKTVFTGSYEMLNYFDWKPTSTGSYQIRAYVKDSNGNISISTSASFSVI